jgi:hypothetical protein
VKLSGTICTGGFVSGVSVREQAEGTEKIVMAMIAATTVQMPAPQDAGNVGIVFFASSKF